MWEEGGGDKHFSRNSDAKESEHNIVEWVFPSFFSFKDKRDLVWYISFLLLL